MRLGCHNPFNLGPLISHLTNSNGCGNVQPKVLLTVSPFRFLPHPQLDPFSRSPHPLSPLSTAFTPNRPLTPLSTAFTQKHRGGVPLYSMVATAGQAAHPKALTPFKMNTCKSVSKSRTLTIFRMNTCKSVSKQKTLSTCTINTYAKTGRRGRLLLTGPEMARTLLLAPYYMLLTVREAPTRL